MMYIIKNTIPLEALKYPILLLMCFLFKLSQYNEYGIRVQAKKGSSVILNDNTFIQTIHSLSILI